MQRHTCWKKHRATAGNMEAVTFQQVCVETEELAPVLRITRVENPESEIRLNMVLLCQDLFLYHYCISLFQHQQLAIPAFEMCSDALQFIQSRRFTKKWSNCRTKASVLHPLGLCQYTVVSRKNPLHQHLSYKLPKTFLLALQ